MTYYEYGVVDRISPDDDAHHDKIRVEAVERFGEGWKSYDSDEELSYVLDVIAALNRLGEGEALVLYRVVF